MGRGQLQDLHPREQWSLGYTSHPLPAWGSTWALGGSCLRNPGVCTNPLEGDPAREGAQSRCSPAGGRDHGSPRAIRAGRVSSQAQGAPDLWGLPEPLRADLQLSARKGEKAHASLGNYRGLASTPGWLLSPGLPAASPVGAGVGWGGTLSPGLFPSLPPSRSWCASHTRSAWCQVMPLWHQIKRERGLV